MSDGGCGPGAILLQCQPCSYPCIFTADFTFIQWSRKRHLPSEKHLSPSFERAYGGGGGQCFLGEIYMISDSPCTNGGFLSPVCLLETNNISCTSPFTFPYGISLFESRLCGACCKLPCVMCLFPGAEQNTELRRQVAGCWCLISLSAVFIAWEVSSLGLYRHWEFQVIKINH